MSAIGRLAVIGGGRMGEAIVGGLLAADAVVAADIVIAEPNGTRRDELATAHSVSVVDDGAAALHGADTVLLAVKPQVLDDVLTALAPGIPAGALVVSIAGGFTCARLESLLPPGTAVVRVMPNTPALVGQGMALISGGSEATPEHVERVRALFGAIGEAIVIDERYQDAGTAISGCGPAYVALFVDALARAGVREGLTRDVAQRLALQTLRGTVELIERTGQHPEAVVDAVASPGGATIAAIAELEAKGFRTAVSSAVRAAVKRARELGS
ncbi:MAG: pyrroline-5-carboxylate reductase [Coriobacteriia bacterium]|nr:pyrroline-5-carboxylate reductase [Coriobacteriia bacterium]